MASAQLKLATDRLAVDTASIEAFCRKHHVRRLALFGSILRDDYAPGSDVDVLVEFDPDHIPGYRFVAMQRELSEMLGGRRVDLRTPGFLSDRIRRRVMRSAETLYAE